MLTPWKKNYDKLKQRVKNRDITLPMEIRPVKVFPVVMYACDIWTIKKAECWRTDVPELWCWRRLLRVPWTATSPSWRKSVLNIHWKDWCWSWNSNTLTTRFEEFVKNLVLGKIEGGRRSVRQRWDGWMASLTQRTWIWVSSGSWWWTRRPGML